MTKKDLRTGHIITLRNGTHFRVMLGGSCVCTNHDVAVKLDEEGWVDLTKFNEDLTAKDKKEKDIVKVEIGTYTHELATFKYSEIKKHKVWERPTYYNGKVVCIYGFEPMITKGKIYEIKDGYLTYNDGERSIDCFTTLEDMNKKCISQFIELVE